MRKLLAATVLFMLLGITWQAYIYHDFSTSPLQVPEEGKRIEILPGRSLKSVARELGREGVIRHPYLLEWMGRLQGKAGRVQAGEYLVEKDTFPQDFLDMLVSGKVIQYAFTLVEGWDTRQMITAMHENPYLEHTLKHTSAESIMPAIGIDRQHGEGWFLPDTYFFVRGTTDKALLQRAYKAMLEQLERLWPERAEGLPYKDAYEALIMASIVEKETGVAEERKQIAGVFVRRLQKGMLLQTDPTVIYGIGEKYDGNIRKRDLLTDTPYNTYTRKGLPPTPIAMPGVAALEAALHPAAGKALYFVSKGDGSHAFAETLVDHNQNVIKYQLNGRERPFSSNPGNDKKQGGS